MKKLPRFPVISFFFKLLYKVTVELLLLMSFWIKVSIFNNLNQMEFKDGYKKMDLKMDMKLCSMIVG